LGAAVNQRSSQWSKPLRRQNLLELDAGIELRTPLFEDFARTSFARLDQQPHSKVNLASLFWINPVVPAQIDLMAQHAEPERRATLDLYQEGASADGYEQIAHVFASSRWNWAPASSLPD
jgi:hypothetical protein